MVPPRAPMFPFAMAENKIKREIENKPNNQKQIAANAMFGTGVFSQKTRLPQNVATKDNQ